ncbi:MAG: HEAT repeat domain-containing protein [Thermodesulfovibrionales bacterium]|nr:HEAT repeat domain-containing protein [Thermodesulfovibrionales bacterium]
MSADIRKLLASVDENVRHDTVVMLARPVEGVPREEAVTALIGALKDPSWRVRKASVDTLLENYNPSEFLAGMEGLLYEEGDAGARNSAIEAFIRLGHDASAHLISAYETDNVDVRKFIVDIAGEVRDKDTVPMLIRALKDEDENVVASAVEHLGTMREPSVLSALVEIIESGDVWTSFPAIEALGNIGDESNIPLIASMIENKLLREPALKALGKLGGEAEVPVIAKYIADNSRSVQYEALDALASTYRKGASGKSIADALKDTYGDNVSEVMIKLAKSTRENVRDAAILFLGLLRDERSIIPLVQMASDDKVSSSIREALVMIATDNPPSLSNITQGRSAIETRFICDIMAEVSSSSYFDMFIRLLKHDDGHVRSYAAQGLANIGDVRAVGELMGTLGDPYEDVQESVVRALVSLKDGIDIDALFAFLKDDNPVLRRNAVMVFGSVGTSHIVSRLGFTLKDDDVTVRLAVVKALASIGTESAHESLLGALSDEDPSIRSAAATSFGKAGVDRYVNHVRVLLADSDDMVRVYACKALGLIGSQEDIPELSDLLDDENGFVAIAAIEAMGSLGGDEAKEILLGQLSNPDQEIKRTVLKALDDFHAVEDRLIVYLSDSDWATRVAAAKALCKHRKDFVLQSIEEALEDEQDPVVRRAFRDCLDG